MAHTAFVVTVPAAESLVGALRERFDRSAQLGVPAHITILFPFMPPDEITPSILADAQAALGAVAPFPYTLARVGRFPETAYLSPEPAAPFVALTAALVARFPSFTPYGGEHRGVIPHLTVAHGDASHAQLAAAELEQRLHASPPIRATCNAVVLLEDSSGRWKPMHTFRLA
ncbi:2'-5' RNA ligase family protein [Burkholderia anthina]|uniref:2'-5' RNA ligase family protein n=1 Tax=Burkholderia anthina TaxID=179879 RepID=UPI001589ECA0